MFDPTEFGIPPNTLEATDTSQLLGLVAAKLALKDAGYDNGKAFNRDRTSVILGVTGTQELVIPLSSRLGFPKWRRALEAVDTLCENLHQLALTKADHAQRLRLQNYALKGTTQIQTACTSMAPGESPTSD